MLDGSLVQKFAFCTYSARINGKGIELHRTKSTLNLPLRLILQTIEINHIHMKNTYDIFAVSNDSMADTT